MNVFRNILRQAPLVAMVLVLFVTAGFAQQTRGTLRGVIKDELGATIVGATVTLTDATGVRTATTNGEGAYVFNGLAPGKYSLRAAARGFANSDESEVDATRG